MMSKAQAATEYLMTFAWAIVIISVAFGVLYQTGIFNQLALSSRTPPGACQVVRSSNGATLVGKCDSTLPRYVAIFNYGASSYIDAGQHTSYLSNSVTFVAWVRPYEVGPWRYIISLRNASLPTRYYYQILVTSFGNVGAYAYNGPQALARNSDLKDLGWHQIAFTAVLSGPLMMYVDAKSINSIALSGSDTVPMGLDLFIGARDKPSYAANGVPLHDAWSFNGMISNVQFYNTSLTQSDLSDLYWKGMGGSPINLQNLVGWWPLNGNANDYSGNNNNGEPYAISYIAQYGK